MYEHFLTDELLEMAQAELSQGRNWISYNSVDYFLDKGNVEFFPTKWEAIEHASGNISEYDHYYVTYAASVDDLLRQVPRDNNLAEPVHHYSQQNSNTMERTNLDYLKDNLKYFGFGDTLNNKLEASVREGKPEFQLHARIEYNGKPLDATLYFRQSDKTGMYFFNNYKATLERTNGESISQTFYLNKGKGITSKEAFNLLDGRAVEKSMVTKEGQAYKGWLKLDFENQDARGNHKVKQFHEVYGFDLKAAVSKLALPDLNDPKKSEELMKSLQKGNLQAVAIDKDGMTFKMFIEADPQFKKVTLYDANLKLVPKENLERYTAGVEHNNRAVKEDVSNDKKKDLKPDTKPEQSKAAKKNDKPLLPKKRESTKKGLSVG